MTRQAEQWTTEIVEQDPVTLTVRAIERKTGHARTHRIALALLASPEYRSFVRVHGQLVQLAGTPPFSVALGDTTEEAESFAALQAAVLRVAGKGVQLQRFKGLGEMNSDQLCGDDDEPREPDARPRDDGRRVGRRPVFTMLMGDKVEPRREFIEDNARLVADVDV